ncbi:hypothetical protein P9112_000636 [Eukaryota sp. TZLM1-RC]
MADVQLPEITSDHPDVPTSTESPKKSSFNKLGIRPFYSIYYAAQGILIPNSPVFLSSFNLTGFQMSIAIMLGPLSSILTIPVGFLADKNKSANKVLLYCVTLATIFLSFLLFADTVVTLILGYGAYALFNAMLIPLSDSLAIAEARQTNKTYSSLRIYGSVFFVIVNLAFGQYYSRYEKPLSIPLFGLVGLAVSVIVAIFLDSKSSHGSVEIPSLQDAKRLLSNKILVLFLVAGSIHWCSLQSYILLFSVHMRDIESPGAFASYGWSMAVFGEILLLVLFSRFKKGTNWLRIVGISMLLGAVRWFITAIFTSLPLLIVVAQFLHAATFATFHCGSIEYMEHLVPASLRTTGRSMYNLFVMGIGGVCGQLLSGWLYDIGGGRASFLASAGLELVAPLFLIIVGVLTRRNSN